MIITESIGDSIIIRGRDEHGERYEQRINRFQPYFYVPRQNIVGETYYSLFGETLQRITCVNQKDFKSSRKLHEFTYEGDVPPTIRYLIDNYYQKGIESEVIRVCFFDIETDGIPNISKADTMITSIAAYDNFRNLYYCFTVAPDGVVSKDKYTRKIQFDGNEVEARVFMFVTEKEMLNKFLALVQQLDFDLFLAWNGDRFDYPYLFNRMKALKINPRLLSPIKQMGKGYGDIVDKPRCRIWLDLMVCYKKLSTQEMESYSLDYISRYELGAGKIEHQEKFEDFWRNNLDKFIEYNIKDVYLMVKIEESKGIVKYFDTIRRFTFCSWYDVFYNSKVLDCFFLLKAKEYGIVLPTTRKQKDYTKITGAIVITPTVGVHQNVAVGDVRSLYPTAILTCNMSPETIVTDVTKCNNYVTVDDVYFSLDKRGFIPRVVEDLWNLRQKFKNKRDTFELGSHDYEMWDTIQTVCKFLLNSVYGVMLAPHFRLFTRDIGKSITYFGRRTNLWMQEKVKEREHEIVGGDTDAILFKLKKEDAKDVIDEGIEIIDYINNSLDYFCESEFGDSTYNKMFIEFEKIYGNVFFVGDEYDNAVKKRYAGLIVYKDGADISDHPKLEIKGFEAKRSDTPTVIRELQSNVFKMILTGKGKEEIFPLVKEVRDKIIAGVYSPYEIGIPKGVSKDFHEYTSNMPIHIHGAIYFNKYCNGNIKMEKMKYIYVKDVPPGLPKTHAISFTDEQPIPEGFVIDYARMEEKLIREKFNYIFLSMGWNIHELDGIERFW
jgi:DNA polymerase I